MARTHSLPDAQVTLNLATVTLGAPTGEDMASDQDFAVLDGVAQVKVRREQDTAEEAARSRSHCSQLLLCGQVFPVEFLVAAHVKKRPVCSDEERRDLDTVAILTCAFGCDALYESGWITVDQYGHVQAAPLDGVPMRLAGLPCAAHSQFSGRYFSWHRTTTFRGSSTAYS